MSREARSGGFGSSGSLGVVASLSMIAVGLVILVGAIWFGVTSGAAYALPLVPKHWDSQLGEYAMKSMISDENPCAGSDMEAWLRDVGPLLVEQVEGEPFEYQWFVIDDETPNAFALPGGWVGVHRGLFAIAQRPEEVASVVAHEIIHAENRHGTARILGSVGTSLVMGLIFGGTDLAMFADKGMQLLMLKHSRSQEEEADAQGLMLMERAGIDPEGMATMFEALGAAAPKSGTLPAWFSTHPDSQARAAEARSGRRIRPTTELPKLPSAQCTERSTREAPEQ